MDRRVLFIGGGVLLTAIIAVVLVLLLSGEKVPEIDEVARLRENTLTLAREYLEQGEYARALDLIDRLLIENARDGEAKALRDEIIDAQRLTEQAEKERALREQEDLKNSLAETIKESSPQVVVAPPPEPKPEPKEDPAEVAAREAAKRRQEEETRNRAEVQRLIKEGIEAMESGRFADARSKFDQALSIDGNSAVALAQMGEAYFREDSGSERNLQKAVEYSTKAIEKDPSYWLPHFTLGKIYQATSSWENAIRSFSEAARLNPERDDIWYELGKVQYRARYYSDAAKSFETSTHVNPKNSKAFYNLGVAYERLEQKNDALKAYQSAVASDPRYDLAYYSMGAVQLGLNQFSQAISNFEKAVALAPSVMRYLRELARTKL